MGTLRHCIGSGARCAARHSSLISASAMISGVILQLAAPIGISLEVGKVGQKMGGYYDAPHWVIGHWSRLGQLAQKVYSFVGALWLFLIRKYLSRLVDYAENIVRCCVVVDS